MRNASSRERSSPSLEKPLSPEREVQHWFADFFAKEYARFQKETDAFELPDEYELRGHLEGTQLTPSSEPWGWFDVTNGCLLAFTAFIRERQNAGDAESLETFLQCVDQQWLSRSPNILVEVAPSTSLVCFGELMTMPTAQNTILTHLLGEANYLISFSGKYTEADAKRFIQELADTAGTDERLLVTLAYLPPLFRYARTLSFSQETGTDFIRKTLRYWASSPERSILQRLVSSSVIEDLGSLETNHPLPALEGTHVQTEQDFPSDHQAVRLSRDTVGVLDRFHFLREVGTPPTNPTRPDAPRAQAFSRIEDALTAARIFSLDAEYRLYQALHSLREAISTSSDTQGLLPFIDAASALFEAEKRVREAGNQAAHERDQNIQRHPHLTDAQRKAMYEAADEAFQQHPALLDLEKEKTAWKKLNAKAYDERKARHQTIQTLLKQTRRASDSSVIEAHPLARQWPDASPETIQQNVLILQMIHHPRTRTQIEERTGCSFVDLSLREQLALGTWLLRTNETHGDRTLTIIRRFGADAARTFLACEGSLRHGELILAFAETAPEDVARQVFHRFAEIADKLDLTAQSLAQVLYRNNEGKTVDAELVRKELIRRGAMVLLAATDELKRDPTGHTVFESLAKYQADTTLFASLFSSAVKQRREQITLEDVRDLSIEYTPLPDLTDADRSDMRALTDGQWAKKPSEELFPAKEDAYTFFLLRYRGRVAGFARLEALSPDKQHVNFFCMDERLRGSGIGEQLLQEMLERLSKTGPILCEADPGAGVASMYIERFGCVCTHIEHEQRGDRSLDWLGLSLDRALNKKLVSRDTSEYMIRMWLEGYGNPPTNVRCERVRGNHAFCEQEAVALIKRYTHPPDVVMSRMLRRKNGDAEEWVLVFERAPQSA